MAKNILIIDDDKDVASSLSNLLTKVDYVTTVSYDGNDALNKISGKSNFDLIICDIRLPGMNGVELVEKIKQYLKNKGKPEIPVIFITGYADADLHLLAQDLGKLFIKPFENKDFLETVNIEIERVPHDIRLNYDKNFVTQRRKWLTKKTGAELSHLSYYSAKSEDFKGTVENFIGVAQVPVGIAGPLMIKGSFANGTYYVPFATSEATLLESYQRGMIALTKSGGVNATVHEDEINITPIFSLTDLKGAKWFADWVKDNFTQIKYEAESTTRYGKLLRIDTILLGKRVLLKFCYTTGDAMGLNMIVIATDKACRFIASKTSTQDYYLRSNLSSDKKACFHNSINTYGKNISAEAILPKKVINRYLKSTPEKMFNFWRSSLLGSLQAGSIGLNAQYANALAAIFIACGQDVASIINSSVGISMCEITSGGDLYTALKIPALVIGTIGGGTYLSTQRECLEILGCYGVDKAKKLAEIIAATLLAGEISICAAFASGDFAQAHIMTRKMRKI